MPTTYENLLRSALGNATRGMAADQVAMIVDQLGIADTLFPIVSQAVSEAIATDEYKRSLLRREKSITLVAGTATLTDDVLTKFIADSVLFDPASLTKKYAWRDYPQFVRRSDPRLGEYTLRGGTLLMVRDPNQQFAVPLTATGARTLVVPCVVVKPATAATAIDAPDEVISDLDEALSTVLRGELTSKIAGASA
jgi:hypothetical protein